MWSIQRSVIKNIHYVNQMMSGGSFVAIFDLKIEPSEEVTPSIHVDGESPAMERAFQGISEGFSMFVQRRSEEGRPVIGFRVAVTDVVPHEDFKSWRFAIATAKALQEVFAEYEHRVS
jgi:hypothetical protein